MPSESVICDDNGSLVRKHCTKSAPDEVTYSVYQGNAILDLLHTRSVWMVQKVIFLQVNFYKITILY
jgi:hypothetical protein